MSGMCSGAGGTITHTCCLLCSGRVGGNPNTNRIYVVNNTGSIGVINGATNALITTIPVAADPFGIAVNKNTNKVYVAHRAGGTVTVIDGATNALDPGINNIVVGSQPQA